MMSEIKNTKDFRDTAKGFGVCTIAVLILYALTGMNAVNMRELHISVLMAVFTACCAFYVTSAFVTSNKRFWSAASVLPAFGLYMLIFRLSFDAAQRMTIVCLSIMENVMMWAGLGTVAISVLILILGHKLKEKDIFTAILAAGFVMRAVMVLLTPLNFFQHDVSNFESDGTCFHDDYILYIANNFALPSGDVRDYGMFYHPPLHYMISAMFFRLQNVLPVRFAGDINGLKMLPMLWTSYLILFAEKTLDVFGLKGRAKAFALVMTVFCPQMIFLSIQVNNDALALMLFVASFYIALKWYSKPELTTILFLAITIGCAMMTKLSMGFIAFPVAFLFLVKLVKTYREAKASARSKDKSAKRLLKDLIKQFAAFAVVVFPLGMWFPLRNLISYGTPITYVFAIDESANQDVWMFSPVQRLFVPSKEILEIPFLLAGGTLSDYNIFLSLLKTGLFDERKSMDVYLTRVAQIMLVVAFIYVLVIIVCSVAGAVKRLSAGGKKLSLKPENIALWILAAVLVVPEIVFCFQHPVVCTQSFRYIAPVLIPAAVWSGSFIQMSEEGKSGAVKAGAAVKTGAWALMVMTVVFVLMVLLFYGPFPQYSMPWEFMIFKSTG
ncbi:phospholipid carrier-dependent glycosyltransferase [Butyrivibrio sp. AE2032]|uniref:phospholipid carrier-dependent glycosyltransferase n=1 Tax=Butyrivibrio sp. AE2032 TaxID=1458463 RepID=UPI0009DF4F63|nr:phospholipid carrier-dependent glycosyltransferase [Butyrivibrio sp. AE2032]